MNAKHRPLLRALPWILAVVGLAVPMIGSGFIGWPFAAGWLLLLLLLWWTRPLGAADRSARIGVGIGTIVGLVLLATLGGFYFVPAVVAWLVLVLLEGHAESRPAA